MDDFRLNQADAVLINYAGVLILHRWGLGPDDAAHEKMVGEILCMALRHAHIEDRRIGALAKAAQAFVVQSARGGAHRERYDLEEALRAVLEWRGAMALEAFNAVKAGQGQAA